MGREVGVASALAALEGWVGGWGGGNHKTIGDTEQLRAQQKGRIASVRF